MRQRPAARRQRLARIGETRPAAKWFHEIGREFNALYLSDIDHPISYNQRATARTSAKRKRHSRRSPDTFPERLRRLPRNATVVAATDMELVVVGERKFAGLLDEIPGFARKLLAGTAHRLGDADARAIQ
jgi:CRP-like cAMP-binding protein